MDNKIKEILEFKAKKIEKKENINFIKIDEWNRNVDNEKCFALIFQKERSMKLLSSSEWNFINVVRIVSV